MYGKRWIQSILSPKITLSRQSFFKDGMWNEVKKPICTRVPWNSVPWIFRSSRFGRVTCILPFSAGMSLWMAFKCRALRPFASVSMIHKIEPSRSTVVRWWACPIFLIKGMKWLHYRSRGRPGDEERKGQPGVREGVWSANEAFNRVLIRV